MIGGSVLYGASGEVLVDAGRDAVRDQLVATLTSSVLLLLGSHASLAEGSLDQGLTPEQRRAVTDHLLSVHQLEDELMRVATLLFGSGEPST